MMKKKRKTRILTEEHKERIRATMLENKRNHTEETRKLQSDLRKEYWKKRKEKENGIV